VPALWLDYKAKLRNFIYKRVHDADLTNDILQEVLLKVYKFCMSKSGVKNVRSWLFQITQNTIIDYYRKQSKISFRENLPSNKYYTWDNQKETIQKGNFKFFRVLNHHIPESFFAINPDNGYLA